MQKIISKQHSQESKDKCLQEAEVSIARYCAYQERTILQVQEKLELLGITGEDTENIINKMISEGFINEQRYAIAFTFGKLNQNKWGRLKITNILRQKGINNSMIESSFSNFGKDKYIDLIKKLIRRKSRELKETAVYLKKNKIARFLIAKGFESDLIWDTINKEVFEK